MFTTLHFVVRTFIFGQEGKNKMSALEKVEDRIVEFKGIYGFDSWCVRRIYKDPLDKSRLAVVFIKPIDPATGGYANSGTSITNAAEVLASQTRRELGGIEPVAWLHYWPRRGSWKIGNTQKEEFNLVSFERWDGRNYHYPYFIHQTRHSVEALLGGPFES